MSKYNELKTLNESLSDKVTILEKEKGDIEKEKEELLEKIKILQEKYNLLLNGRRSATSSTPPSHDIGRANKINLRVKTGRKSGGQTGHQGTTLCIKELPDEIIDHKSDFCNKCGADIQHIASEIADKKQEVVIPPIQARYVEHRSHVRVCPCCNATCTGTMPTHLKAPIQYGVSVSVAVAYFSVFQHLPYKRIATMFDNVFNLPISEGTIYNMLERTKEKAIPVYKIIQKKIEQSSVVGGDETGCRINNRKGWVYTFQNGTLTFMVASFSRGYDTISTYFNDGFPKAVYVSDCLPAQLKTPALKHQLCMVHLIRELTNFIDALSCNWSKAMKQLLQEAIHLEHQLKKNDYQQPNTAVKELEKRLDNLLASDYSKRHQKVQAFTKRLIKNRDSIFTFLYHFNVPADNNGSERAIRMVKVKSKVSGQFRSEEGAEQFVVIHSVIGTTIKNGQNVYDALTALENLVPT